jgi:hypothetical protein
MLKAAPPTLPWRGRVDVDRRSEAKPGGGGVG